MSFSQGTIQLPPNSTGSLLDTDTGTRGSSTVHRQITKIGGSVAAAILDVLNTDPTGSTYALPVRIVGGTGLSPAGNVLTVQGLGAELGSAISVANHDFDSGDINLTAAAQTAALATAGGSTTSINVRGTYVGTLIVEGQIDLTTWVTLTITPLGGGPPVTGALPSAAIGQWLVNSGGLYNVRVRMATYTSGTAIIHMRSSSGSGATNITGPLETTTGAVRVTESKSLTMVSASGASGAIATATVPAAGVGLFNYISMIQISAYAAAAVTGGATPVLAITTGITNTPSFTFGTAKAIGTNETQEMEFSPPLKGSATNTAATVVGPATTGFLWRVNVSYYTST